MARWDRRTRLLAELGLRDETKRGLASASRGFQTYLSGNSRAAGMAGMAVSGALSGNAAFAAAGMGSAFLTMAGTSLSAFVEMEKKWAEVTTLMPQMNEEALGVMKQQIDRFARETGTTLADAYQATYQAVSAGIEPGQTESFLRVAHTAATAGVTDLTTAVDGITSALNAYGLETREAIRLSDDMFTAVRLGKTTFGEMAASLGLVMPLASSMNTEFRELAAASAALTAQGNTQAIATTQIRAALVALSKDTKARTLFESVTGMSYPDWQRTGGTLAEAMKIIHDEAVRLGVGLPEAFGRIEGANAALALAGEGALVFAQVMADTTGATEEAFDKLANTTDYGINKMKAEWEAYKTWFGEDLVEDFSVAYGNFNDLLAKFGVGMTMNEKRILEQSEENWRAYARNMQRLRNEQQTALRGIVAANLAASLGGGFQPGAIPGVRTGPPVTQAGPGSAGEWLFGVSGMGAGGGDVWALGDMNQRFNEVLQGNIRDAYGVVSGGGGGGGGRATAALESLGMTMRELTDLMRSGQALTVQLDANIDEGVILRADTVRRETGQVAARLGNLMVDRVRS